MTALFALPALRCQTIALSGRTLLHDVRFAPRAGEFTALCGPNGAGKTTLIRALAGLLPGTTPNDPRRVAYVAQGARSAWGLTVRQVVELGRIPHGDTAAGPIERAMAAWDLTGLRDARVDRISGGEARRAMLARALATEPVMLLLDEPTADLDPAAAHAAMRLLRALAGQRMAVVAVLHAIDLALEYAQRMLVLQDGRVVADGAPGDCLAAAAAAFGMRAGSDPAPRLLPL